MWVEIKYASPKGTEDFILWNGKRRFVGWLNDDGWHDSSNQDHYDVPEATQPTHFHPWPEPPKQALLGENLGNGRK